MQKSSCSNSQQDSNSSGKKYKGTNWTETETRFFLNLCIEKRIIQMMDGKRCKHIDIYNSLEPSMKEMGFIRNGVQMKTKLKHLKEMYFKCKRNNNTSGAGRQKFAFYDEMEQFYNSGRPSVQAITDIGIDSSENNIQIIEITKEEPLQVEDNVEADLEDKIKENEEENEKKNEKENEKIVKDTILFKKRKTGRNTHMKLMENFAEVFTNKQIEGFQKVMKEQMRMFDDSMQNVKQWEKEMIEKEHQHQNLILETFIKELQTMQSANFQHSQFVSNSVPMHTFPSTSVQNVYPYHLSPFPSLSSHSLSSSIPVIASLLPSSTFINSPEINVSMPSLVPSSSSSYNEIDISKHVHK